MSSTRIIIVVSIISMTAGMAILVGCSAVLFWPVDGLGMNYLGLGLLAAYILASLLLSSGRRSPPVGVRRQPGDVRPLETVGADSESGGQRNRQQTLALVDVPEIATPDRRLDHDGPVVLRLDERTHEPLAATSPSLHGGHRRRPGGHRRKFLFADRDRPAVPAPRLSHGRRAA